MGMRHGQIRTYKAKGKGVWKYFKFDKEGFAEVTIELGSLEMRLINGTPIEITAYKVVEKDGEELYEVGVRIKASEENNRELGVFKIAPPSIIALL